MKLKIFAFILLCSTYACKPVNPGAKIIPVENFTALPAAHKTKEAVPAFSGDWKRSCDGITYLSIGTAGAELVVNDNQINIKTKLEPVQDSPGTYNIKFVKAGDLGAGGAGLDWDSFSTDSAVAQLRLIKHKPGKAIFSWMGFFNKKSGKRDWVDQSDLNMETGNNAIDLQKCN